MTVEELIYQLQKCRKDLPVKIVCPKHEVTFRMDINHVDFWMEDNSIQLSEG